MNKKVKKLNQEQRFVKIVEVNISKEDKYYINGLLFGMSVSLMCLLFFNKDFAFMLITFSLLLFLLLWYFRNRKVYWVKK
jgi:hypothetical protein